MSISTFLFAFLIYYSKVSGSMFTYETMFISAEDNYKMWIDGKEVKGLTYFDVWSFPDRVEVRSDAKLIAVQMNTVQDPAIAHGLIVYSHSGKFDTSNHTNWRCKDFLESTDKTNWYIPGFIRPKEWPEALVFAPNSNFRSQINPWPGPVRMMPSDAMWVGSRTLISSSSHCLLFLDHPDNYLMTTDFNAFTSPPNKLLLDDTLNGNISNVYANNNDTLHLENTTNTITESSNNNSNLDKNFTVATTATENSIETSKVSRMFVALTTQKSQMTSPGKAFTTETSKDELKKTKFSSPSSSTKQSTQGYFTTFDLENFFETTYSDANLGRYTNPFLYDEDEEDEDDDDDNGGVKNDIKDVLKKFDELYGKKVWNETFDNDEENKVKEGLGNKHNKKLPKNKKGVKKVENSKDGDVGKKKQMKNKIHCNVENGETEAGKDLQSFEDTVEKRPKRTIETGFKARKSGEVQQKAAEIDLSTF